MKNLLYLELISEMAKHGDNQSSIGRLLGLSRMAINNKMAGRTEWTMSEIETLCNYYHKTFEELFKRNENY